MRRIFRSGSLKGSFFGILLVVVCVLGGVVALRARGSDPAALRREAAQPVLRLLAKADSLLSHGRKAEAMTLFEAIASRDTRSMTESEARAALRAGQQLWRYQLLELMDINGALEAVDRLEALEQERRWEPSGEAELGRGIVKMTLNDVASEIPMLSEALGHLRLSFHQAYKAGNTSVALIALGNMLVAGTDVEDSPHLGPEMEMLDNLPEPVTAAERFERNYTRQLGHALALSGKRKMEALDSLLIGLPADAGRSGYYVIYARSRELERSGNLEGAVEELHRLPHLWADSSHYGAVRLDRFRQLGRLYDKMHQRQKANEMYRRYTQLRDTVYGYRQISALVSNQSLGQIRRASREVERLQWQARQRLVIILSVSAMALLVTVACMVLVRKTRRLRLALDALYEKIKTPDRGIPEEQVHDKEKGELSQEDARLLERMNHVRDTSDEVFSADFSATLFAQLVGDSYRRISRLINEQCHCNFMAYIARRRIAEACRRIDTDAAFRRLTTDAMAAAVGIRSRTTFVKYFMMFTGFNPGEYVRRADKTVPR